MTFITDLIPPLCSPLVKSVNFPGTVDFNESHRSHLLVHLVFGRHGEVDDRLHVVLLQGQALDQAVVGLEVGVLERLRFVSLQLQLSGKQIQWESEYLHNMKTRHLNTGKIWKRNILKIGIQVSGYNADHSKNTFCLSRPF